MKFCYSKFLLLFILFFLTISAYAESSDGLNRLQKAYPNHIKDITSRYILWSDGSRMIIRGAIPLFDKIVGLFNHVDQSIGAISNEDVEVDRYEPFFRKMYGKSAPEVKKKLVTIYWMPNVFGTRYPLRVTTVNDIHVKLQRISAELEKLPPSYYKYLENPAGGFYWRNVKGQSYLSSHSFGIAVDINSHYSNYWLWDRLKTKRPIAELVEHEYNHVPMKIVRIFEKEGFFWGGRWYFYDTMHFEYRPELFVT